MYKSPLYEMATPMELKAIRDEDIVEYAQKHLSIDAKIVKYVIYYIEIIKKVQHYKKQM